MTFHLLYEDQILVIRLHQMQQQGIIPMRQRIKFSAMGLSHKKKNSI